MGGSTLDIHLDITNQVLDIPSSTMLSDQSEHLAARLDALDHG
jgi:hypothetical protein